MSTSRRACLVFGGTYGLGANIAMALADAGADVAVSARTSDASVVDYISALGRASRCFAGDMTNWTDVRRVVGSTVDFLGGLDVVVVSGKPNGEMAGLFLDSDPETFVDYFRDRTVSRLLPARAAADVMKEHGGGRIIFLTTDAGRVPTPAESLIGASAAAVIFATRALGRELAPFGIRVNTVSLTLTKGTPVYERYQKERSSAETTIAHVFERIEERTPLGLNEPEDVAALVVYLASKGARQITGATISINGGLSFP